MSISNAISGAAAPSGTGSDSLAPATPSGSLSEIASGTADEAFDFAGDEGAEEGDAGDEIAPEGDETEEAPAGDETTDEEVQDEAQAEFAGEETEESAPIDLDADPEAQIKVGKDVLSAKDVKAALLRHSDYTQKTQKLAEASKAIEAERQDHSLYKLRVDDMIETFSNPDTLIREFAVEQPEVWAEVERRVIERYARMADMTPAHLADFKQHWESQLKEHARTRRQTVAQKVGKQRELMIKTAELSKSYQTWRGESMRAAGLDPDKEEHFELVTNAMVARHRDQQWTKELFDSVSARVAKSLGVKPPKPKKDPAPPAKASAKLPPVRPPGQRRPAFPAAKGTNGKAKKPIGSAFDEVRRQFNLR